MTPIVLAPTSTSLGTGLPELFVRGTGMSVPVGLEDLLEYNGLVFNDRSTLDRYEIHAITRTTDIRDSREINPSNHGESVGPSLLGGMGITIEGTIVAGNFPKIRDMYQALRACFMDTVGLGAISEMPLYYRTGDATRDHFILCRRVGDITEKDVQEDARYRREFMITLRASQPFVYSQIERAASLSMFVDEQFTIDNLDSQFAFDDGQATMAWSAGSVAAADGSLKRLYVPTRYTSLMASVKAVGTGGLDATAKVGVGGRRRSANYHLAAYCYNGRIRVGRVDGTTITDLATSLLGGAAVTDSSPFWIRGVFEGDVVSAEYWTTDPILGGSPDVFTTATLAGLDAQTLGADATGYAGIYWLPGTTFAQQTIDEFLIQARRANGAVEATNMGSFRAPTRTRISGQAVLPVSVFNPGTGQELLLSNPGSPSITQIDTGASVEAFAATDDFVDQSGEPAFEIFDEEAQMIDLLPGEEGNYIDVELSNYAGAGCRVDLHWRDTWA